MCLSLKNYKRIRLRKMNANANTDTIEQPTNSLLNIQTLMTFIELDEFDYSSEFYKIFIISNKLELTRLSKSVKQDDPSCGVILSNKHNIYTLCLKNTENNDNISFVNFKLFDDATDTTNITNTTNHYIYINYTFTYITHRQNGFNKMLRLLVERIAKHFIKSNPKIISVPLPGANSCIVLDKLNYNNNNGVYCKILD